MNKAIAICFTVFAMVAITPQSTFSQSIQENLPAEKPLSNWYISLEHGSGLQRLDWDNSFYNTYDVYGDAPYNMLNTNASQNRGSYYGLFPQRNDKVGRLELEQREFVLGLSKTFVNGLGVRVNFIYRERPNTLFRKSDNAANTIGPTSSHYDSATTRVYDTARYSSYTYPVQSIEFNRQIGGDISLFYDLLNRNPNKSLNLHAGIGFRHYTRKVGFNRWLNGETHLQYRYQNVNDWQDAQGWEKVPGSEETLDESVSERFMRTGLGFSMNFGIEWVHFVYKNWGYSLGVHYDRVGFTPNRMTRTEFSYNGEDRLPDLNTRQTDFRFGSPSSDNPDDNTQPRVLRSENYNFNVFMLRAGICYRL